MPTLMRQYEEKGKSNGNFTLTLTKPVLPEGCKFQKH